MWILVVYKFVGQHSVVVWVMIIYRFVYDHYVDNDDIVKNHNVEITIMIMMIAILENSRKNSKDDFPVVSCNDYTKRKKTQTCSPSRDNNDIIRVIELRHQNNKYTACFLTIRSNLSAFQSKSPSFSVTECSTCATWTQSGNTSEHLIRTCLRTDCSMTENTSLFLASSILLRNGTKAVSILFQPVL